MDGSYTLAKGLHVLRMPVRKGEQRAATCELGLACQQALDTQEDVTALHCFVSTDGIMAALWGEFASVKCGRQGRTAVRSSWERIYMQIQGLGKAFSLL